MKTRHWDRLGNGGLTFTNLSMGTAPLGNLYQAISDADAESTLEAAWQAGVRHFDTAPLYGAGTAERRLGRFLFQKDRADWTMSSKVGRLLKVCEPSQRLGIGKFFAIPSRAEVRLGAKQRRHPPIAWPTLFLTFRSELVSGVLPSFAPVQSCS